MANYLYRRMNREFRKIKYRAVGSAVLIIIAVALYVGLMGMMPVTKDALDDTVGDLALHDHLVQVSSANEGRTEELGDIAGIRSVESRLLISARLTVGTGSEDDTATLVHGLDPARQPTIDRLEMVTGDSHYFRGNGSGTVLVERNFAKMNELEVGDRVAMKTLAGDATLTVAGIVRTPEYLVLPTNPRALMPMPGSLAVVYVPDDWLRTAFGLPDDHVNQFVFLFDDGVDREALQEEINEGLKEDIVLFTNPKEETEYAMIMKDFDESMEMLGLFALIFLGVAFFIVYISFARIVQEQRREIGVLRALGYSRGSVLGSYLYMAVLIGSISSLIGLAIGVPFGGLLGDFYLDEMLGMSASGTVVAWSSLVIGFLFGPVTAMLACVVAVWGTVTMDPQDAIKGTPRTFLRSRRGGRKAGGGKGGGKGKGRAGRAPRGSYISHYTYRNMSRHKARTIFTVIAVGGAVMLGSYALLVLSSFYNSIEDGTQEYERWDVLVEYSYPLNGTAAELVTSPHITEREEVSRMVWEWREGSDTGMALVIGMDSGQDMHRFKISDGKRAHAPDECMFNRKAAEEAGIRVGDTVVMTGAGGQVDLRVTALVEDYIGTMFVDTAAVEALVGEVVYHGAFMRVADGHGGEVLRDLKASPLVSDAQRVDELNSGLQEYFESYGAALYIVTLLGVAVAAPTLVNIVFVGVLERYPEYGQLRAIGYSKGAVSRSIFQELMVIVTGGAIVGMPLTYALVLGFEESMRLWVPSYSTLLYPADWLQFLAVVLMMYAIALLAAWPSVRHVNRMDIARTIGERGFG